MKKTSFLALGILLLTSCLEQEPVPNAEARNRVQAFAEAYFNYDFQRAAELVTPESMKWLRFAASNITEQQLQLLQQHEVKVEADMSDYVNDTMQVVTLKVNNYLAPTPLGGEPTIKEQGTFRITLVKRDNKWKVRMEGLPRNEKQSRD